VTSQTHSDLQTDTQGQTDTHRQTVRQFDTDTCKTITLLNHHQTETTKGDVK